MSRALAIACALSSVACSAPAQEQPGPAAPLSEEEHALGFRLLFDGATTDGWRTYRGSAPPAGWGVADGALTAVGPGGDIITEEQFGDFELRVEWNVSPGGNSGILYRVTEEGGFSFHSGPEMQVLDDAGHAASLTRLTAAGSNYDLHAAAEGVVRPAGEWNDVRILVDSAHVEHWLNDVKVVDYDLWTEDWEALVAASKFAEWPPYGRARVGHIALQNYGDRVAYRAIRIRTLR